MDSPSPAVHGHVARLTEELNNLQRDKKRLIRGQRLATDNRRQHKIYYSYLLKKQELLVHHNRAQREELYNAVMSGDASRISKIELKMVAADNRAHELQAQIPARLKHFAEAIKREQEYEEAIRVIRNKISLKLEEIHKYQPCENFLCDHCRGKTVMRLRRQKTRKYKDEVEGAGEEEKQHQGMMRRIVRKVRKLSF